MDFVSVGVLHVSGPKRLKFSFNSLGKIDDTVQFFFNGVDAGKNCGTPLIDNVTPIVGRGEERSVRCTGAAPKQRSTKPRSLTHLAMKTNSRICFPHHWEMEATRSCFALLPFSLNVLTAGISAFSLSSCVLYALGVNLISVCSGTSIHGLRSCGTFIKYA